MGEQLQAVRQGLKPCTFYRNVNQESLTTTVNQKLSECKMAIGCFLVNCNYYFFKQAILISTKNHANETHTHSSQSEG